MYFLVIAKDKHGHETVRDQLRPKRLRWLEDNKKGLVAAGGMTDDQNQHVHGGLMIVDMADRGKAEAFANDDPFTKAGLYDTLEVVRWRRVYFNGERIVMPDPFKAE